MKVARSLVNKDGKRYFVELTGTNPGRFIRLLWQSCFDDPHPQTDEDAAKEWTHRRQSVRTSTGVDRAYIRTHAWSPAGDHNELPENVLAFIDNNTQQGA